MGSRDLRVAIVGAGASGIAAAIKLREMGVTDLHVFEKGDRVGGTWRDNIYPGLTCDVPSHLYRYSFAPNPDWSTEYASGPEILRYFEQVSRDRGVNEHVRLRNEVRRAEFVGGKWRLETDQGDQGAFDALIFAVGVLHTPVLPNIEGRETFRGVSFHTSRWRPDVNLAGARVGIIGTGSTAVQILPAIVGEVASVALFQRTPQWVVSVENNPISEEKRNKFHARPETMDELYRFLADRFNSRFAAALVGENDEALKELVAACNENLEKNVQDPGLRARLTPNYAVGCKRLVVSNKFYPAIQHPHARLIDSRIERITPSGVVTRDGVHELDVLIYATGFDPFNFFKPMQVIGKGGRSLGELWERSSSAHRTVAVPGFPNLFFIGGPNSPIGNFSFVMTAETQLGYITQLVEVLRGGVREIEPKQESAEAFTALAEKAMAKTVWVTGGCDSWYFDKSGKVASWPWTYERFQAELAKPNLADFDVR